MQQMEV